MQSASFIANLRLRGKHCFSIDEASEFLGPSKTAVRASLRRLKKKGEIAMPYRGFYVIIPPEYGNLGCLPARQFIPQLMKHLGMNYYAGLLSAAEFHGAAHHRPQIFQVVVEKNRPSIECGRVRVNFIARKNVAKVPCEEFKTSRGYLKVSVPEIAAYDLVGYPDHSGGLDNVATILMELSEKLSSKKLLQYAPLSPIAWSQRLGYLLETIGSSDKAKGLERYINREKPVYSSLVPSKSKEEAERNNKWRLIVNTEVEIEY